MLKMTRPHMAMSPGRIGTQVGRDEPDVVAIWIVVALTALFWVGVAALVSQFF